MNDYLIIKSKIRPYLKYYLLTHKEIPKHIVNIIDQTPPITLENTLALPFENFKNHGKTLQNSLSGKNKISLLNALNNKTTGGAVQNISENTIIISGRSSWGNYGVVYENIEKNSNKTLSCKILSSITKRCGFAVYGGDNTNFENYVSIENGMIDYNANTETYSELTFNTGNYDYIAIRFFNNGTASPLDDTQSTSFTEIQLEEGSTATSYEEYCGRNSKSKPRLSTTN